MAFPPCESCGVHHKKCCKELSYLMQKNKSTQDFKVTDRQKQKITAIIQNRVSNI